MRIYKTTNQNLLLRGILKLGYGYLSTDFTLFPITSNPVSTINA